MQHVTSILRHTLLEFVYLYYRFRLKFGDNTEDIFVEADFLTMSMFLSERQRCLETSFVKSRANSWQEIRFLYCFKIYK